MNQLDTLLRAWQEQETPAHREAFLRAAEEAVKARTPLTTYANPSSTAAMSDIAALRELGVRIESPCKVFDDSYILCFTGEGLEYFELSPSGEMLRSVACPLDLVIPQALEMKLDVRFARDKDDPTPLTLTHVEAYVLGARAGLVASEQQSGQPEPSPAPAPLNEPPLPEAFDHPTTPEQFRANLDAALKRCQRNHAPEARKAISQRFLEALQSKTPLSTLVDADRLPSSLGPRSLASALAMGIPIEAPCHVSVNRYLDCFTEAQAASLFGMGADGSVLIDACPLDVICQQAIDSGLAIRISGNAEDHAPEIIDPAELKELCAQCGLISNPPASQPAPAAPKPATAAPKPSTPAAPPKKGLLGRLIDAFKG